MYGKDLLIIRSGDSFQLNKKCIFNLSNKLMGYVAKIKIFGKNLYIFFKFRFIFNFNWQKKPSTNLKQKHFIYKLNDFERKTQNSNFNTLIYFQNIIIILIAK